MIKTSSIRIPRNYLLIKPDQNYDTYQRSGKDTGILSSNYIYEKDKKDGKMKAVKWEERNYASYGKVYGIPERLSFHKAEIKELDRKNTILNAAGEKQQITDYSLLRQIHSLKEGSNKFKVPVEAKIGDTVRFSYQAHKDAREKGMAIDTDEGEMFFVKYDQIYFSISPDGEINPLNGYVIVDPITKDDERTTSSGLIIPDIAKGKGKEKRTKKALFCRIVKAGCITDDYLDRDISDPHDELNPGDTVLIDPRGGLKIEHDLHQQHFDRTMYLVRRYQILVNSKNNPNFAEIKIGYEQLAV